MSMIWRPLYLLFLFCYFLSIGIGDVYAIDSNDGKTKDIDFAVAGYLPDYRLRAYLYSLIQGKKKTTTTAMTDLLLFSLQPHARGFFHCCLQEDHYELVEKFLNSTTTPFSAALFPPIRIWVTLGGGGRTEAFPEICADKRLRQRLIGSVLNLSARYSFLGGIDLDFFQPRTIQERDNYILFLYEAIQQWHHHGLKVSLTLHPHQGKMIPSQIYELLDRVHFMAYDMIQVKETRNNLNNNYHASISRVRQVLEDLLAKGGGLETAEQRRKVLLGIPAYARYLRNPSQVKTFAEIYDAIHNENESSSSSSSSSDSSLSKLDTLDIHSWGGYEWESPSRIRAKIALAKELRIGGIFFWELGQDKITSEHPTGILLETSVIAAAATTTTSEDGTTRTTAKNSGGIAGEL